MAPRLPPASRAAAALAAFSAKAGQIALIADAEGRLEGVLFGLGESGSEGAMIFRGLAGRLPAGDYRLDATPVGMTDDQVAVAFALGAYRYDRYKKATDSAPRLRPEPSAETRELIHAVALARDMINTPANHMGPLQVETIAREIAAAHGARIEVVVGDALIEAGYPAIHAVGAAATPNRAPRMIEIGWGEADAPHLVIIGKGVVFDSGGLDIKPAAGMRQMKKDMGGAAHALALGRMVMAAGLPVRLTVLTPVVENAIAGDAMRPGDVLASRKGLTIEVGNTDAEGRLILADALARAAELEPDLTIDLATLTGAARVALGPELSPFYTDDETLAGEIAAAAAKVADPIWRMPLWRGYESAIDSDIADVANEADAWAQAGSITAALFLKRFAPAGPWAHFDIFAWNPRSRPGWPKGAEVQAIRGLFEMFKTRWG
ncbi:MAG TPA: leucyl aminopeptidase family protein [Caulobacteraceae bacterium]|nr:leucyl aminopeptidase family protein [Caulobacteraceae bacterium]